MFTFKGQKNSNDTFYGSSRGDLFLFAVEDLNEYDILSGRGGVDTLRFTTAGLIPQNALSLIWGIEEFILADGTNEIAIGEDQFTEISGSNISIFGGSSSDTIDGSNIKTNSYKLDISGGDGLDALKGSAGNDIFRFTHPQLSGDMVRGNGGVDKIILTTAGTFSVFDLHDVQGVEQYILADGSNILQLSSPNAFNVLNATIFVTGGRGDDIIDASRLAASYGVELIGGGGSDQLLGGSGIDRFVGTVADLSGDMIIGGSGHDILAPTSGGAFGADALMNMREVEVVALGDHAISLSIVNANFIGVSGGRIKITGGFSDQTVDASSISSAYSVEILGGGGGDILLGSAGNDLFRSSSAQLSLATIHGNDGRDTLDMTTAARDDGRFLLSGVRGIEIVKLADVRNILSINDNNMIDVATGRMKIIGGCGVDIIDASSLTASYSVELVSGAGADVLRGGAGDDLFRFAASHLIGDRVRGNGGNDTLAIESPVVQQVNVLADVQGIENILLADGFNRIFLRDSNFTDVLDGRIAVTGGAGRDIIGGALLTGTNGVDFTGGDGQDVLRGGGGIDRFIWSDPGEGGDVIDFFQPGTDKLVFQGTNFALDAISFDVRTEGDSATNLMTTDLFVYSDILADADDVQALLATNGTGDSPLFIVARDDQNHTILYYTALADGSVTVNEIADLGASVAPMAIGLADFVIG